MKAILIASLLSLSLPALADRYPLPADTPASFRDECGSCHLPYPPAMLSGADWKTLMNRLDKHFGTDATVDRAKQQEIASFLQKNASTHPRATSAKTNDGLPRISQTAWFTRKHDEIPARFWKDPRVKSAANCGGCHRGAEKGRYSEHDITLPELREH